MAKWIKEGSSAAFKRKRVLAIVPNEIKGKQRKNQDAEMSEACSLRVPLDDNPFQRLSSNQSSSSCSPPSSPPESSFSSFSSSSDMNQSLTFPKLSSNSLYPRSSSSSRAESLGLSERLKRGCKVTYDERISIPLSLPPFLELPVAAPLQPASKLAFNSAQAIKQEYQNALDRNIRLTYDGWAKVELVSTHMAYSNQGLATILLALQ